MTDDRGWIPAHRKLFEPDHWLAPSDDFPASRRGAWLDLCQMATHKPRKTWRSGTLERGELVVSVRTVARRWHWSKSVAHRFLGMLEQRDSIETVRGTPDGTVYRVVNYDTYAVQWDGERDTLRDRERDNRGTPAGQEQQQNKGTTTPPNKRARRSPERPLPDDWRPTEAHTEKADRLNLDLGREAEKFRHHAAANDRRQRDWSAAFHSWLLKADEFRNGKGKHGTDQGDVPQTYEYDDDAPGFTGFKR